MFSRQNLLKSLLVRANEFRFSDSLNHLPGCLLKRMMNDGGDDAAAFDEYSRSKEEVERLPSPHSQRLDWLKALRRWWWSGHEL